MSRKKQTTNIHQAITAHIGIGLVVLDAERKIIDINPAAAELLNLRDAKTNNRALEEVLGDELLISKEIKTYLGETSGERREFVLTAPGNSKSYILRITDFREENGQLGGHLLQFTNISQQKQAEDDLAASKENLNSLVDTLKDYYFETDIHGVVTNINQAFCAHLGYSRKDEIIGKHIRHFTDRDSVRSVFSNFDKVFNNRETIELFRYTYHTRDGSTFIGETTVSPMLEGGRVIGARGVLRDITERVRVDELLQLTRDDLERRVKELSVINRISALSNSSLNLNHILQTLCVELTSIFPVRNVGIGLITEDMEALEVMAFHSVDPDETSALGMMLPLEGNIASREVIEKKRTIVIQNSQTDARMNPVAELAVERGTKAIMIVPLLTRGNAIGTIGMPAKDPEYVFQEKEIELAEIIAGQIASAIDNARLYAKTEKALDIIERDLEIGKAIQSSFFPEEIPEFPEWEIAVHFESARYVSGDFYDIFQLENPKHLALVIADVCDKGVGAAFFMVLFRSLFRAFSKIHHRDKNIAACLEKTIHDVNNYVATIHRNANMFATVFFGILDMEEGVLYHVNGGHEPPAMLNREGKIYDRLQPTGPVVGLFESAKFRVEKTEFRSGDFLVSYTDGTLDAQDNKGASYSEDRLLKYIQAPWTSLFSMIYEIKTELRNHEGEQSQFDDITLLSIRRKPMPFREKHAICREAKTGMLGEILDFTEAAAGKCKLSQEEALTFRLAVEKTCRAIFRAGFEGEEPRYLSLSFECDDQKVRLFLRDDGQPLSGEVIDAIAQDMREEAGNGKTGIQASGVATELLTYRKMKMGGNELVIEKTKGRRSKR